MKEFLVYTVLRLLLFGATLGVVLGIWLLVVGDADVVIAIIIAFIVSGIGSYVLLNGPRERFAQRVDERARRAASRFEEMRAKEDDDLDA